MRPGEETAWVAVVEDRVVGHVSVSAPDDELRPVFGRALGSDRLALLTVLFVALESLGSGAGARLHDVAVAWIRDTDRVPVLDVVSTHERAVAFYRRRGWREIGSARPAWLPTDRPDLLLMALDS